MASDYEAVSANINLVSLMNVPLYINCTPYHPLPLALV